LIRMTADGRLPEAQRRNYRHVFHALASIVRAEVRPVCVHFCAIHNRLKGIATLWRGTSATVTRAMILNAAQLGTYSQAKSLLLKVLLLCGLPS
jgi:solute carrier family 25 oxoglutarate transporter 11